MACKAPDGYVEHPNDCNDDSKDTHPDATEICNDGEDNDCDGTPNQCGLSAINDLSASRQVAIRGTDSFDGFGSNVSRLGNLDGLGGDEFAIASQSINGNNDDGGALQIFWAPTEGDDLLFGLNHDYVGPVTSYKGINFLADEAAITLIGEKYAQLGTRIVPLGDLNDDGYDDFAVSAPVQTTGKAKRTLRKCDAQPRTFQRFVGPTNLKWEAQA